MKRLKNAIILALAGNRGRLVAATSALSAAAITAGLARFGLELGDTATAAVSTGAGWLVNMALDAAIIAINGRGVEAIQRELQRIDPSVAVDRWAGSQTVGAVAELVEQNAR